MPRSRRQVARRRGEDAGKSSLSPGLELRGGGPVRPLRRFEFRGRLGFRRLGFQPLRPRVCQAERAGRRREGPRVGIRRRDGFRENRIRDLRRNREPREGHNGRNGCSRHEATRVGDARTAGWTAAAALLSVPIGKGGGPKKSESLSALASAATVRLLDDALEGLPAVSQNANPGSADEPSHRLLAGLRAVHRLVEVVVPMYPGEPESGLGRKIALAVEKSVKSSRFRKNAPAWAAATACVLHPRLFGSSPRMHSRDASDGSSSCAIDGVGACAWFVAAAVKSGGKSGGSRILRVVSHALSARLVRWPEHARHYAREVWALGLSGEGGFTRAERLAMAQHWHEREVAAEVLTSNGGKNTYGDDAGALADWLEDGGCGGAAGGHVAARVAALSLAHALARAEAPTGSSDGSNNGHSSDDSSAGSRVVSAESYRAAALDGAEALLRHGLNAVSGGDSDLTRDTYRRGSITHRRKVRAWQMLCALTPAIDSLSR